MEVCKSHHATWVKFPIYPQVVSETMLTALDLQMALSSEAQKPEGSLTDNVLTPGQIVGNSKVGEFQTRSQTTHDTKDIYPDL